MGKLIELAGRRKRPESPTRAYVESSGAPFVNHEEVSPPAPEKPHPVHQAASMLALARMATANLSPRQKREALLRAASMLATCPRMQQAWQNKADHTALSISGHFSPLEDQAEPEIETAIIVPVKHQAFWPWLFVLGSLALAIAVTPPFWVS